jgi:hypothetical protein
LTGWSKCGFAGSVDTGTKEQSNKKAKFQSHTKIPKFTIDEASTSGNIHKKLQMKRNIKTLNFNLHNKLLVKK